MPTTLNSKVFWLAIGMNDMVRGGCSEEVTMLGILRVADEIYFQNPNSVIVIQGILPWSNNKDGSLDHKKHGLHPFEGRQPKEYTVKDAKKYFTLWPSIQHINSELEKFCAQHEHLVYFDVSALFLGSIGNHVYRQKEQHIITALLNEGKTLTFDGYTVLGVAVQQELKRIIYDGNEKNDVEGQP
jgi:hypothetical protein